MGKYRAINEAAEIGRGNMDMTREAIALHKAKKSMTTNSGKEALNKKQSWRQGYFLGGIQYRNMTNDWKAARQKEERHKVRPSPTGNAICRCSNPDDAAWIAERLNLASKLEQQLATAKQADIEDWQPIKTAPDDRVHIRGLWVHNHKTGVTRWDQYLGYVDEDTGCFIGIDGDHYGWSLEDYDMWHEAPTPPSLPDPKSEKANG